MQNTWLKLDEPSMYRHGLGTQETERSNMSHIVDMINMEMFTIETTSSLKEICPRGNNKVVILYFLIHDKGLLFMLEFY